MKKWLVLVMCLILVYNSCYFSNVNANGFEEKYQLNTSCVLDVHSLESILRANQALTDLITAFSSHCPSEACSGERIKHTFDGLTVEQYPDYYGGAYINVFGNLVILLTDMSAKEAVMSFLQYDQVEFRKVEYSKKYLLTLMEMIGDYSANNDNRSFDVVSTSVDDFNNCLRVGLRNLNLDTVHEFEKEIISSQAIEFFENSNGISFEVTNYMNAGTGITTSVGSLSISFRCKRTNSTGATEYGFVTARHGFNGIDDWVKYDSVNIGTRTLSYNTYDCAFVKVTNSDYQAFNDIGDTGKKLYTQQLGVFAQGTPVWKYGQTSFETQGTVTSATTSFVVDNITYYDAFQSSYGSAGGDSGSPVYVYGTSVYQSLVGMHVAEGGYAEKASNIISLMGLTRY